MSGAIATGLERSGSMEAALSYLRAGAVPIALDWPTGDGGSGSGKARLERDVGKRPLVGDNYQFLRPDEAQIQRWWRQWPMANVGLLLEPSALIVVDADCEQAIVAVEAAGVAGAVVVKTGKGRHYFFKRPEGVLPRRVIKARKAQGWLWNVGEQNPSGDGVDVLARGYVVVGPSVHRTGRVYDVPDLGRLKAPPAWVVEILQPPESPARAGVLDTEDVDLEEVASALDFVDADCDMETFVRVGMAIHDASGGSGAGLELFDRWASRSVQGKYNPREPPRRWRTFKAGGVTARSLFKMAYEGGWSGPERPYSAHSRRAASGRGLEARVQAPAPFAPGAPPAWLDEERPDDRSERPQPGADSQKPDDGDPPGGEPPGDDGVPDGPLEFGSHVSLARVVRGIIDPADRGLVSDEDQLWRFDGLSWQEVPGCVQRQAVHRLDRHPVCAGLDKDGAERFRPLSVSRGVVDGTLSELAALEGVARPGFFALSPAGLQFADAFITCDSSGLIEGKPPDPELRQRGAMGWAWDPQASAPRWRLALSQWLAPTDEARARAERGELTYDLNEDALAREAFLGEFIGACLFGVAVRFRKAVVLLGGGHNGKSKFIEAIQAALPSGSWSSVDPQDFGDEYRAAMLAGKRMNFAADIPAREILSSSALKAAISGDVMTARHIRQDPFQFSPRAGHIFSANELPATRDHTEGFWSRFVVVEFAQRFEGDQLDPHLGDKLRQELPGIVAWGVEGAARLMRQGRFTTPASSQAILDEWRRNADSVAIWLDEQCEPDAKVGTAAQPLWRDFKAWTTENNFRPMGSKTFYQRLAALVGQPRRKTQGFVYDISLKRVF